MASTAPAPQLRVGLVLSGGGARGAAHVGVLKVLDELHVHVDAIAGTSMGAVVGGLYASGLSGREIEKLLTSVDWQDAFRDRPRRADLGFRRKEEDRDYLVNLPLGVQGRKLAIPTGLLQGQKLTQILRRATLRVASVTEFDRLPTRFRAVATDLETGAAVIMDSGDLTTALRASMAAPGFVAPVERNGRLLVDGGLVENLPIEVVRAMGVDVLIVVDAGFPLQTRDKLTSLTSVSNQALAILVRRDQDRQRATLTPRDILLQPSLGQLSSYDFSAVAHVVQMGEMAAREAQPQLQGLAATREVQAGEAAAREAQPKLEALAAPSGGAPGAVADLAAAAAATPAAPLPTIQFITTQPGSRHYAHLLKQAFADQIGKPLDPALIEDRIATIYGRGNLEQLDYQLVTSDSGAQGLDFTARRNSWGPNYLKLGLSLQDDFNGNSVFNAAMRLDFTELNPLDAEAQVDLQLGAAPHAAAEFYQPLSNVHRYFVAPHVQAEEHELPQLDPGVKYAGPIRIIGDFRIRTFDYGLDLGRELGNWGELRAGVLDTHGSTALRTGDFTAQGAESSNYHSRAGVFSFNYDRLDSTNFPRSGQAFSLRLLTQERGSRAGGSDLLTYEWRGAWSAGKNTAVVWISGGSIIGGNQSNVSSYFPVGGFLSLSGVPAQSLAGPQYAIGRLLLLRSVGTGGEGVLNVPAYVGVSAELGNVWCLHADVAYLGCRPGYMSVGSARRDASLFFGADTFLGPAYLAVGYDQGGTTAFYLFLGRSF
jgi:NTE family protein